MQHFGDTIRKDTLPCGQRPSQHARAVIDACRPYERLKDFPMVAKASPELRQRVAEKFADVLKKIGA